MQVGLRPETHLRHPKHVIHDYILGKFLLKKKLLRKRVMTHETEIQPLFCFLQLVVQV